MNQTDQLAHITAMFQTLSQSTGLSEINIIYASVLLVGGVLCFFLIMHQRKTKALNKKFEKLQNDLLIANSTTIGMGQKLLVLEKELGKQREITQQKMAVQQSPSTVAANSNVLTLNQKKPAFNTPRNNQSSSSHAFANAANGHSDLLNNTDLPSDEAYEKSRLLLSQGFAIEDVVKQSGLSFSEVSLMKKLAR